MIRTIFFGTNEESLPALRALIECPEVEVLAVITGAPKPQGRHQVLTPMPVDTYAREQGKVVWYFEHDETLAQVSQAQADVHVVVSFGAILKPEWLAIPTHGTINVHPSLLPLWRGPTPVQASIRNSDLDTGVSLMLMDAKMDHGPLLWQSTPLTLKDKERAPDLLQTLMQIGADHLVDTMQGYIAGSILPTEQEHDKATYCKLLSREDGFLAPGTYGWTLDRLFRALTPWPGVWCVIENAGVPTRIKILDMTFSLDKYEHDAPIHALREVDGHIFAGNSRLCTWQWEGKPITSASDFAVSHPNWSAPLVFIESAGKQEK